MSTAALAAVARTPDGPFTLESVELDDLHVDEVRVRVAACGVCHTDAWAKAFMSLPAVLGHEGAGVVEAIGADVRDCRPGDHVIVSYPSCGHCGGCRAGMPYHCDNIMQLKFDGQRADGSRPIRMAQGPVTSAFFQQSTFATRAITLARDVTVVARDWPWALLAALPCGVMTGAGTIVNIFRVAPGESMLVCGAGAVGLSAIMAARIAGADPIIATDVVPQRLALARELGATHALDARDGDLPARVRSVATRGVDYALDTTGRPAVLGEAVRSLAMGGQCAVVTTPEFTTEHPFPLEDLFVRAASLRSVMVGRAVPRQFLPQLLEWHARGRFPVDRLIRTYAFTDINVAFSDAHAGTAIKPVLLM